MSSFVNLFLISSVFGNASSHSPIGVFVPPVIFLQPLPLSLRVPIRKNNFATALTDTRLALVPFFIMMEDTIVFCLQF